MSIQVKNFQENSILQKIIGGFLILITVIVGVFCGVSATETVAASNLLEIPAINLETSVKEVALNGNNLSTPNFEAGIYHAAENKEFIIGHSSTIFSNLFELERNDKIIYNETEYRVVEKYTSKKEDVNMNLLLKTESEPTLIIMTCAGEKIEGNDYSERLIIRAEK